MICQGEKYCDSNWSKMFLKLMVLLLLLFVLVGGVALALDFVTLVLMFQVRHLCCCCWWILMCWCRRSFCCCCCCRCWCCQGWCWWGETVSVEARVWVRCDGVAPARVRRGRPAFEGGGRTLRTTVGRNTECWTLNTQHSELRIQLWRRQTVSNSFHSKTLVLVPLRQLFERVIHLSYSWCVLVFTTPNGGFPHWMYFRIFVGWWVTRCPLI